MSLEIFLNYLPLWGIASLFLFLIWAICMGDVASDRENKILTLIFAILALPLTVLILIGFGGLIMIEKIKVWRKQ